MAMVAVEEGLTWEMRRWLRRLTPEWVVADVAGTAGNARTMRRTGVERLTAGWAVGVVGERVTVHAQHLAGVVMGAAPGRRTVLMILGREMMLMQGLQC